MDYIRWRIVGVMFLPSIFENRCGDFRRSMWRLSKIDVSPFEDRRSMSRCVDLRRSMCRPSEIDVLTFEDRWSMCRPSKIDGRCEIRLLYLLKTLILYIYKLYANYTEGVHFSAFISIRDPYIRAVSRVCANGSLAVFHRPVVCAVKT